MNHWNRIIIILELNNKVISVKYFYYNFIQFNQLTKRIEHKN